MKKTCTFLRIAYDVRFYAQHSKELWHSWLDDRNGIKHVKIQLELFPKSNSNYSQNPTLWDPNKWKVNTWKNHLITKKLKVACFSWKNVNGQKLHQRIQLETTVELLNVTRDYRYAAQHTTIFCTTIIKMTANKLIYTNTMVPELNSTVYIMYISHTSSSWCNGHKWNNGEHNSEGVTMIKCRPAWKDVSMTAGNSLNLGCISINQKPCQSLPSDSSSTSIPTVWMPRRSAGVPLPFPAWHRQHTYFTQL